MRASLGQEPIGHLQVPDAQGVAGGGAMGWGRGRHKVRGEAPKPGRN